MPVLIGWTVFLQFRREDAGGVIQQECRRIDVQRHELSPVFGRTSILPPAPIAFPTVTALPNRASKTARYSAVFDWLGYRGPLSLLIQILPIPAADVLLARYIRRVPDAGRRTAAIQAMGTEPS